MVEVKSRVSCSEEGCSSSLEYWATLDITSRDTSDTFQTSSTPEIEVSAPSLADTQWSTEGNWTKRYYCPTCTAIRVEARSKPKRKK